MPATDLGLVAVTMFLAVAGITRAIVPWLAARGIVDKPNLRSSHSSVTPRGGGIVLVALLIAAAAGSLFITDVPALGPIAAGAVVLMALSFIDDMHALTASTRLLVQGLVIGAVTIALGFAWPGLATGWLPAVLLLPLIWLGWLWFTNLFNFMDGIDGIVGVELIAIGVGVILVLWVNGPTTGGGDSALHSAAVIAALLLASGAAGFLTVNWHPSIVFLGDVGSITLGFLAGALLIALAELGQPSAALILPAYFVTDATLTLGRRAWRRERLSQPHRSHAYQFAVRGGASHSDVCLGIALLNAALVGLAVLSADWPFVSVMAAYILAGAHYQRLLSTEAQAR